jgi:hypothetical protein
MRINEDLKKSDVKGIKTYMDTNEFKSKIEKTLT